MKITNQIAWSNIKTRLGKVLPGSRNEGVQDTYMGSSSAPLTARKVGHSALKTAMVVGGAAVGLGVALAVGSLGASIGGAAAVGLGALIAVVASDAKTQMTGHMLIVGAALSYGGLAGTLGGALGLVVGVAAAKEYGSSGLKLAQAWLR